MIVYVHACLGSESGTSCIIGSGSRSMWVYLSTKRAISGMPSDPVSDFMNVSKKSQEYIIVVIGVHM